MHIDYGYATTVPSPGDKKQGSKLERGFSFTVLRLAMKVRTPTHPPGTSYLNQSPLESPYILSWDQALDADKIRSRSEVRLFFASEVSVELRS